MCTYFYVFIYKIGKQWKLCPRSLSPFFYSGKFVSTTLGQPICHGLDLIPLKDFGPTIFMLLSPELSTLPFLLDHSRQHTQIPLHFPTPRLPMLPSCFLYSRPPLLHLLIPPQRVFCSFPFTLAVVSKVTKACFPVVHRHGYLLTFSYSVPRHQSKLWSQLSISFFWGCLFSFYACGSTLS